MAIQINIEDGDIEYEISKMLNDYSDEIKEKTHRLAQKTALDGAKKLKGKGNGRWIKYNSGWGITKKGEAYVIHNKKHYQLTHLLEFGHISANQYGRYSTRVRAYPHIAPVEKEVNQKFEQEVKKIIESAE